MAEPTTLAEWQSFLSGIDLPVLRKTAAELAKLAPRAETLSAKKVAHIVLLDPLMSLKVLDCANKRNRSRFNTEITTIEHAILLLGVTPFFEQFAQLQVLEDLWVDRPADLQEVLKVICRSQHAAYQAHEWAVLHLDVKAEESYLAALTHDVEELLIRMYAPELARNIDQLMRDNHESFQAAMHELLGYDLEQFRLAVSQVWRFPELLLDLLQPMAANRPRVRGVLLAVALAHHSVKGWWCADLQADVQAVAAYLKLSLDDTAALIHRTAVYAARQWEWYHVLPAATWLPMLPGAWPDGDVCGPRGQVQPGPIACPTPQPHTLELTKRDVLMQMRNRIDWKHLVQLVLKGMHDGLGLERVLFAAVTPQGGLQQRAVIDTSGHPWPEFRVNLSEPHLFGQLMKKQQALWRQADNAAQVDQFLTPAVKPLVRGVDFFAMSVFSGKDPIGLFYADRGPGCGLDEKSYREFKQLCVRAGQGLAHIALDFRALGGGRGGQ